MRKSRFLFRAQQLAALVTIASLAGCSNNCATPPIRGAATGGPLTCTQNARVGIGVPLGSAGTFAVLASSTVTSTGPTVVTGDLGVSPGSAVTGFPPGIVTGGSIHAGDSVAAAAPA